MLRLQLLRWRLFLAVGFVVALGYVVVRSGAASTSTVFEPETGVLAGGARVVGNGAAAGGQVVTYRSAPASSPTPTATPSTGSLRPYGLGFAPYVYVPWGTSVSAAKSGSGATNLVMAFVQSSSGCTPAWDGDSSLGMDSSRANQIARDIDQVRAAGGDVSISFGGASGTELAVACSSATNLAMAYRSVIDKYNLTKIDLDIEGATVSNTAGNARRADASLALQAALPSLRVWVTLGVDQSGLASSGTTLLQQLRDKGVVVSGVNIMVMDYGTGVSDMGLAAQQASGSTFTQLKGIYPGYSDANIWKAIGLTAMVGINDTQPETFTLANSAAMRAYAVSKGIGMLSYWNTDRDKACPGNAAILSDSCSGVSQSAWAFALSLAMSPLQ